MKRARRRQTAVLEVAALMTAVACTGGWLNVSPGIGSLGAAIVLVAASIARVRHDGWQRPRSPRARCIDALVCAALASETRGDAQFPMAFALLAVLVWVCSDPDVHQALAECIAWRKAKIHTASVRMDEA
jgi:hypothetical protein